MYLLGLIFLVVGLVVSVALHELGHLLPAKKFGAMVPEYWIGFGPPLFSRRIGNTVYGVKAVLLGGYVRIVGMYPPQGGASPLPLGGTSESGSSRLPTKKRRQAMVDEAREQSAEDIAAAHAAGLTGKPFYELGTGQKLLVMFGGPVMNLLLAFLITTLVIVGIGWKEGTTTVAEVVPTNAELGVNVEGASPAEVAGLKPGDTIVQWGTVGVESWEEAREAMGRTPPSGVNVLVDRNGQKVELRITPIFGSDGAARIGVVVQQARVRGNLLDSLAVTGALLKGTVEAVVRLPVSLWELGASFFNGAERDPNGVISIVGVARVAGEVSSVEDGGSAISLVDRLAVLLSLLASLNIALFVFNLLPLPPLDGGHIGGFCAAEKVLLSLWVSPVELRSPSYYPPCETFLGTEFEKHHLVTPFRLLSGQEISENVHRFENVGDHQNQGHRHQQDENTVGDGHHPSRVRRVRLRFPR